MRAKGLTNGELLGKIFSGKGEGKKFLEVPWVRQQIKDKLGFTPYVGTLNLKLADQCVKCRKQLEENTGKRICPQKGYCVGLLFGASIEGERCGVIIPQVEGYPEDVLEIVAAVNLKQKLNLKDGDVVTVKVNV